MVAIVDDDELMRGALQGMLKSVGLPSQAFASAKNFGIRPATAGRMPDRRYSHAGNVRSGIAGPTERGTCRIPTIFITAHGRTKIRMQALRAGAVEFLAKPFDDEVLLDSVRAALENRAPLGACGRQEVLWWGLSRNLQVVINVL